MKSDIALCEGINCSLRGLCERYMKHKLYVESGSKEIASYVEPTHVGNGCEIFLRTHED